MLIGIDVGGTNIVAAAVDEIGQICAKQSIPANISCSDRVLCSRIAELAHAVADGNGPVEAVGLANLINILQPEIVCLGGGISHADDDLLLNPLRERILPYIFDKKASVRLERAALGNNAGLIGAALLCRAV